MRDSASDVSPIRFTTGTGICAGGWADLGEFPIAGFSKTERVYGLLDETPAG